MKKIASVSGGKSSAYMAANYYFDDFVFALVQIECPEAAPKDKWLISQVEQRIKKNFIATAEDDLTLYSILDLEQYIGRKINWVVGHSFDYVLKHKGGWLPNMLHRYCTSNMKIEPIFNYWFKNYNEPVKMGIGFRADQSEVKRQHRHRSKVNKNGLLEFEHYVKIEGKKRRKKFITEWNKPYYPMIDESKIYRQDVNKFWQGKPVRFAKLNNCIGCFHKNPLLLRTMADRHPNKFEWFASQEGEKKKYWRSDCSYRSIQKTALQATIFDESDFTECDSGHCGL